jgi:galactose oxidase-like protein
MRPSRLLPFALMLLLAADGRPAGAAAENVQTLDGQWTELTLPPSRTSHTAIYDPVRQRMVMFGGDNSTGHLNDLWGLSLSGATPAWSQIVATGTAPSPRIQHTAIYDPLRDRMIVFGGNDGTLRNDVWALSLSGTPAWTQLTPTGTPPTGRQALASIYDPVGDRMVIFGGNDGSLRNDVWALSLSGTPAWTNLTPAGTPPTGRYGHSAIYDPVRSQMIVYGGTDGFIRSDVWALSLSGPLAWTSVTTSGTAPARASHSAIYDAPQDRMVIFGGSDFGGSSNQVWVLPLDTKAWSNPSPTGTLPAARANQSGIFDPSSERMVISGGLNFGVVGDTWSLALPGTLAWSRVSPAGPIASPVPRWFHSAILDAARNRMVVFGGLGGAPTFPYYGDVWTVPLSGDALWASLGSAPFVWGYHRAIYDVLNDRMVVYDGSSPNPPDPTPEAVWALNFTSNTWTNLTPASGGPGARFLTAVAYDPPRQRMLVFGGNSGSTLFNDVWALSLSGTPTWTQLTPMGAPPIGRTAATLVYVPEQDAMVLFGGGDGHTLFYNDVWRLSLAGPSTWTQLAPAGTPPDGRYLHTAVYDDRRHRMLIFGGVGASADLNDAWALSLDVSPTWSLLSPAGTPPSPRGETVAVYASAIGRMMFFAGGNGSTLDGDLWALDFGPPPTAVLPRNPSGYALDPLAPNPAREAASVLYALPRASHVRLEVVDLAGRLVATLANGIEAPGRHEASWRATGHPSGVYFVRMEAPGFTATRKLVLTR